MSDQASTTARPPVVVARLIKNTRETVGVQLSRYREHELLDLRVYDRDEFPTKAGISLQLDHAPALLEAVEHAILEGHQLGLLRDDLVPDRLRPAPERKRVHGPARRAA